MKILLIDKNLPDYDKLLLGIAKDVQVINTLNINFNIFYPINFGIMFNNNDKMPFGYEDNVYISNELKNLLLNLYNVGKKIYGEESIKIDIIKSNFLYENIPDELIKITNFTTKKIGCGIFYDDIKFKFYNNNIINWEHYL